MWKCSGLGESLLLGVNATDSTIASFRTNPCADIPNGLKLLLMSVLSLLIMIQIEQIVLLKQLVLHT